MNVAFNDDDFSLENNLFQKKNFPKILTASKYDLQSADVEKSTNHRNRNLMAGKDGEMLT